MEAKTERVDTQLRGRRPGLPRQALQAQHFLAAARAQGNPIGARGGLQSLERPVGIRFGEVGLVRFFDESSQACQYAHGALDNLGE
jgi:hypothetical protein